MRLLREGLTNREIAERLGITLNGARYHVSEILSKLGVSTREEAARWQPESVPWSRRVRTWLTPGLMLKVGAGAVVVTAGVALVLLALGVVAMGQREDDRDTPSVSLPAGPIASGPMGKLVYVDDGDIWTKQLPHGAPQRLTTDGRSFAPRWSPSGEWILFEKPLSRGASESHVMRSDGSDARRLFAFPLTSVEWSPLKERLAYIQPGRLIVEDADGSNQLVLFDSEPEDRFTVSDLRWSPDGQWIAYALTQAMEDPRAFDCCGRAYVGLWASRADGSEHRELLADSGPPRSGIVVAGWGPDSKYILFSRSTTFSASQQADGIPWQMIPVDPNDPVSGGNSVITAYYVLVHSDFADHAFDGRLLVGVNGGGREATQDKRLFVLDAANGYIGRDLTDDGVAATSPVLSPDSRTIAYVQQPEGAYQDTVQDRRIWLIEPDGSNARRLTKGGIAEERPLWSADGHFILYLRIDSPASPSATLESNPGGRVSLWRHEIATGREEMLLDRIEFYSNPVDTNIAYYGHYDWDRIFDWHQ